MPPTIDPGPDEVLGAGHTYDTVTRKISDVVFMPLKRTPNVSSSSAFAGRVPAGERAVSVPWLAVHPGRRDLGNQYSHRLGIRHRQLRVVDRYRPRRDADLGHSAVAQAGLANVDQPVLGSDDAVRRGSGRHVPDSAPGPPVARLLADAVPEFDVAVAAAAKSADLGRIRGIDIRHGFASVLVHGSDSRFGDDARSRSEAVRFRKSSALLSIGWRGSARHWQRYQMAYLLLAGLATPLVVSVHTVVSFDFAISILPGWHTTIFPPYFVAGAIYSGFAMVLTLAIPFRKVYGWRISSPCGTSRPWPK